jgi:uncharacterized protein YukE
MTLLGADTTALRTLGTSYAGASERVEQLMGELVSASQQVEWVGEDAEDFRDAVLHLGAEGRSVARRLHVQGQQLDTEADQQDDASALGTDVPPKPPIGSYGITGKGLQEDPLTRLWEHGIDRASAAIDWAANAILEGVDESYRGLRGIARYLPLVGLVPDAIALGDALGDGDTAGVIEHGIELGLGFIPGLGSTLAPIASDLIGEAMPGEGSVIERISESAADSPSARLGEAAGSSVSDALGFEDGGTADNVLTSFTGAHLATFGSLYGIPHLIGEPVGRANAGTLAK